MKYKDLSDSTKKLYQDAIDKIEGDIYDYDNVMEYSKDMSIPKKKTLYKALVHTDEKNKKRYFDLINGFSREEKKKKDEKLKLYSKDEQEMLDAFKKVMEQHDKSGPYIERYNQMKNGTLEKALLMLHLFHPLRSDYYTVKIHGYSTSDDNYYKDGKIRFNSMVKVKRSMWITLNESETVILEEYIKTLPKEQDHLFKWTSSNSYNKALSRIASEIFGEKFGINRFRHMRDLPDSVKELYNTINNLAKSMNHTLATHVKEY